MKVGIVGTGNLAQTLGRAWTAAGHQVSVTGRNRQHAIDTAARIGPTATAVDPAEFAHHLDVAVVAVPWDGLAAALTLVGAGKGTLTGKTVIDCTNPVDYVTGQLKPASGSGADLVARAAPGAHVVKALHLFAGASWPYPGPDEQAPVVATCGDDPDALAHADALIRSLGGRTAVIGGLSAARQAEEAAGFVMRVVIAGHNPRLAVPDVDPTHPRNARTTTQ